MVLLLYRYPIECKRDEAKTVFFLFFCFLIYIDTQEFEGTS